MCNKKLNINLSKTSLLKGIQCSKALYLSKNPPAIEILPDPDLEAKFQAGRGVGVLAQRLFPGGTEVPFSDSSVTEQIAKTRELIEAGTDVIFEASFAFDSIFIKADILVRTGTTWEINEVKMSTTVKDPNYDDAAIQYYVVTNSGLTVSKVSIVHINNKYERQGDIDVHQLFTSEDVTELALVRQEDLPATITDLREALKGDEPTIDIGRYCSYPYSCEFVPYCWRDIPEDSIFSLKGRGIDKFEYYGQGIVRLEDLPTDELNKAQKFQAIATISKEDSTNPAGVKDFLDSLWYPLCHLDFETFDTPIPPFDGTRPYQKIPFQYSLHVQAKEGAEPIHFEYLVEPGNDPRRELTEKLLAEIPKDACVLTYNQAFEKGVLKSLAEAFPDLAEDINARIENIRDLMVPFRKRDVYRWQMRGSYSIKAVLPALVPELSYEGLTVSDGMMAMRVYHEMCEIDDPDKVAELRKGLLEYCRLDTLAMVEILVKLKELSNVEENKDERSQAVIFIDANVYLKFYDTAAIKLKKLLDTLSDIKEYIFITKQIRDEVVRNKLNVAVKSFISNYKDLGIKKTTLSEHFDEENKNIFSEWNKKRLKIIDQENKIKNEYSDMISDQLTSIMNSTDNVSIKLDAIFSLSRSPSENEMKLAEARKLLGNPPGKASDPIGDQLTWEQFLSIYNGEDIWMITNDNDFLVEYKNKSYINPFLYDEIKQLLRGKDPKINIFRSLSEGIDDFQAKINATMDDSIDSKEMKEIIIEEAEAHIIMSTNIQSFAYNKATLILEIEFYSGATYQYYQVPEEVYQGLINAGSHGSFFEQHVKKAGYQYTKIT